MPVDITNLTPAFLAFWERARSEPREEQLQLWHQLYEAPHQAIFDVYFSRWGNRTKVATALEQFARVAPPLQATAAAVERSIQQMTPRLTDVFDIHDVLPPYVLLVGVFSSTAWATRLHDQPTCFVALEAVAHLPQFDILIAHEAAHAFHAAGSSIPMTTTAIGEALFLEGLATLASAVVLPERPEVEYLWYGNQFTTQAQPVEAWLAECAQRWPDVRRGLLEEFERDDEATSAAYFWAYPALLRDGVPVRVAYLVGYRVVHALQATYTLAEMARWSRARAVSEVRHTLEAMVTFEPA